MKSVWVAILVLLMLRPVQADAPLTLELPSTIHAGEGFTITVHAAATTAATATLYNSAQRTSAALKTDKTGTAIWQIPAETAINAGTSVVIVRVGTVSVRREISVTAGDIEQLDFLTTRNNLTAYGKARTMLIELASDHYGNPLSTDTSLSAFYPDAAAKQATISTNAGLGWTWLTSEGKPGHVRLTLTAGSLTQMLELTQLPAQPATIVLSLNAGCVLADGRDVLTLEAHVTDSRGYPVADSTFVQFGWDGGSGSAQVFDGVAILRVPAPTVVGRHLYTASSESAASQPVPLFVQQDTCA